MIKSSRIPNTPITANAFRERVIEAIRALWGNDYKAAARATGVAAPKWKRLCNHAQHPTNEIIIAICRAQPSFIAWILTGTPETYIQFSPLDNWKATQTLAMQIYDPN